jgi:Arc/MetJ-type ribon-helix-helix transcriptional regulator
MTQDNLVDVKTRIPKRAFEIIDQLVRKGYFSSMADFARQSILDKLINDFEIGVTELEPQIVDSTWSRERDGSININSEKEDRD